MAKSGGKGKPGNGPDGGAKVKRVIIRKGKPGAQVQNKNKVGGQGKKPKGGGNSGGGEGRGPKGDE
jgi:hypothetical protein